MSCHSFPFPRLKWRWSISHYVTHRVPGNPDAVGGSQRVEQPQKSDKAIFIIHLLLAISITALFTHPCAEQWHKVSQAFVKSGTGRIPSLLSCYSSHFKAFKKSEEPLFKSEGLDLQVECVDSTRARGHTGGNCMCLIILAASMADKQKIIPAEDISPP